MEAKAHVINCVANRKKGNKEKLKLNRDYGAIIEDRPSDFS